MPYFSWPCESFGGINLLADADELGWQGAIDFLNVDLDREGRVRSRDGYRQFTLVAAASPYTSLFVPADTTSVLASRTNATDLINSGGTVVATSLSSLSATGVAKVGTPGVTANYLGSPSLPIQKLVGSTFTSGATLATVDGVAGKAMPAAQSLATTPADNRLVAAGTSQGAFGPNALTSSVHHVWFSDAGLPESWKSNNFVQLTPGDGDSITQAIVWRELLFVFKQRKFFVFTGTSTDSAGNPIFNYRTVDAGVGAANQSQSVVAAPDGVYFSNTRGIWKTTGGPPVLVSQALDPLFGNQPLPQFYTGPTFSLAAPSLAWWQSRLYACVGSATAGASCVMVWDTIAGAWLIWNIPAQTVLGVPGNPGAAPILYFAYASGSNNLGSMVPASGLTLDPFATPITSRYQSGFNKFSYRSHYRYIGWGEEKTIRQTALYGQGVLTLTWFRDFQTTAMPGSGNTVTLGASATARGLDRAAARGEALSFKFSSTTGAWVVDSLEAFIRGERPAGEET